MKLFFVNKIWVFFQLFPGFQEVHPQFNNKRFCCTREGFVQLFFKFVPFCLDYFLPRTALFWFSGHTLKLPLILQLVQVLLSFLLVEYTVS